jgi:ubiquinone/menaquinone biosynthesis C-methylase UbiE
MKMKDLFSWDSKQYAKFRPTYPANLYQFVFQRIKENKMAWDCGTGNGQVAQVLASHFEHVFATDISQKQLNEAVQLPNIQYLCCDEKQTPLVSNSIDLITVGQAMHWFEVDKFYEEVYRVAKKGAIIATWGYSLLQISPPIDKLIYLFYKEKIGSFWDAERKHVDEAYQNLPFPFEKIEIPNFQMQFSWNLYELEGYLHTWSSVGKFVRKEGYNPVHELVSSLKPFWEGNEEKMIVFPIFAKLGRI